MISWGNNFDRTITFAPYFEKDILPLCIKAYDRLKKDNNFVVTHTDGENYGAGLRDKIKIIVGGAPVTEGFAKQIDADGYAVTAGEAANLSQ